MALDEATLRIKLGDASTTIISAGAAADCLTEARVLIGRKFGLPRMVYFLTVADQQDYDFPESFDDEETPVDPNTIMEIIWHPGGSPLKDNVDLKTIYQPVNAFMRTIDPTVITLNQIHDRFLIQNSRGRWHHLNDKIYLDPVPDTAGLYVVVLYRAGYTALSDIPADLEEKFWWAAMASALEKMSIRDAPILKFTDGLMDVTLDGGRSYRKFAAELRARLGA